MIATVADNGWADLFDTLDRQWNVDGETQALASSPAAGPQGTQSKTNK